MSINELPKYLKRAETARKRGDINGVLHNLNKLNKKAPPAELLYKAGTMLMEIKQFTKAISFLTKATEKNSQSATIQYALGNAYYFNQEVESAATCYQQALSIDPKHAESLHNLGIINRDQGLREQAITNFVAAVDSNPQYQQAYHNLFNELNLSGQTDLIIQYGLRAIEHLPQDHLSFWHLGNSYTHKANFKEAIDCYQKSIQINSKFLDAHSNLAIVLETTGNQQQAIDHCKIVLKQVPNHLSALKTMAACVENPQESKGIYDKVLTLAPNDVTATFNLATLLHRIGDFDAAITYYIRTLELSPGVVEAYDNLSKLLSPEQFQRQYEQSILSLLEDNSVSDENKGHLYFSMARAFDKSDNYSEALRCYTQANKLRRCENISERISSSFYLKHILEHYPLDYRPDLKMEEASHIPIFIIGMPRSGTTLMEQVLCTHDEIATCGEMDLIQRFVDSIEQSTGTKFPACLKQMQSSELIEFRRSYLSFQRNKYPSPRFIIDKLPINFMYLGLIQTLFPEAKIIHSIRQAEDICLSCYFQNFTQGMEFSFDMDETAKYFKQYEASMSFWKNRIELNILDVVYEELVDDFDTISRKMFTFLDLEWSPGCRDFHKNENDVGTASSWQVRQSLNKRAIGRWKNYSALFSGVTLR